MDDIYSLSGPSVISASNSTLEEVDTGATPSGWIFRCYGFWHNAALLAPSVIFVLYLAFQARKSIRALSHGRSYTMTAYYLCVWVVTILNISWASLQVWECEPDRVMEFNVLSLFTTSGMLFLEVSLIAFLLQGNIASGLEALRFTFIVSGAVVASDMALKAIYLFGLAVPLFIHSGDLKKLKWGLWVVHKVVLTSLYAFIVLMYHHPRWIERLPARPAFYNYILFMTSLNTVALTGCILSAYAVPLGFWLYGAVTICYHALFIPILYYTFLSEFFEEDCLQLDPAFYSEMKDAGFFDIE